MLIITSYLKKIVSKDRHENLFILLGRNGAKRRIFLYFPIYLIQKLPFQLKNKAVYQLKYRLTARLYKKMKTIDQI